MIFEICVNLIGLALCIYLLIKIAKEEKFKKENIPVSCKIINYYDNHKNKLKEASERVYYVDILYKDSIHEKVRLREAITKNQDSILVHTDGNKFLAYKETKSCMSNESEVLMWYSVARPSKLTWLSILILISFITYKGYNFYSDKAVQSIHDVSVLNENIMLLEDSIITDDSELELDELKYCFAKEILQMFRPIEVDCLTDSQLESIVLIATEQLITGEVSGREIIKTGLPIRDMLYQYVKDYYDILSINSHELIFDGVDNTDSIQGALDEIKVKLYFVYAYTLFKSVFPILAGIHLVYKCIMSIIFIKQVKEFRRKEGIA